MQLALYRLGCEPDAQTFVRGIRPLRDEIDLLFARRNGKRARVYAALF
jgi:hypothetical protein